MIGKTIEELYKETGLNCPYLLARCIGLKISHREELPGACGLYLTPYPKMPHIFISTKYDPDMQEATCVALLEHHLAQAGMDRFLTIQELSKLQKGKTPEGLGFKFLQKSKLLYGE